MWVEYIQFSIGSLNEPNGLDKIRSICERSVSSGGHHVKKGSILWEAYREFECAILAGLKVRLSVVLDTIVRFKLTYWLDLSSNRFVAARKMQNELKTI